MPRLKPPSTAKIEIRVTDEQAEDARALAGYLGETVSEMVRRLIQDERRRLLDDGRNPPRRIRECSKT